MRSDQAKLIPIAHYLEAVEWVRPNTSRREGSELWYHSPIRTGDKTPSFKVDTRLNLWFDHGLNEGWKIIDLICKIRNISVRDALALLDSSGLQSASFRGSQEIQQNTPRLFNAEITETEPKKNSASEKEKQSSHHEIISVGDLRNPSLIQYLKDRSIDLDISAEYLQEICFKQHGKDRQYFAIAWKNGEGFEVRNKYFKGFVGTGKTISTIEGTEPESWLIFEWFLDFLSYLTFLKQKKGVSQIKKTVVIMNSTALKKQLLELINLKHPKTLYFFLDNDESGIHALNFFKTAVNDQKIVNMATIYHQFKDVNDWICSDN